METTITDRKVHGSKDSEVIKEERNKKLSETVWSFSLLELQFACAQQSPSLLGLCIRCRQTVFVSFLSISGAERERNEKIKFYYHTNHLGSTAFVTDNNATVTQGFLYAPFGEITTEYNANFGNNVLPKYSFNAKELDEETGMYYYEARYYAPPTFTSRDPMFEKYFWMSPYAYCANNPMKYVDPTGMDGELVGSEEDIQTALKYIQNAAPNMKLEIQENVDDIGSKTYKLVMGEGGVAKTKYEKQLEEAINSTDIKFVISLEENNGQAGSYYGTEYDEGSKQYVSTNKVNLNKMNVLEGTKYVKGSGLMHEMTEGFEMGKIAKRENRKTIERAWRDEGYSLVSKDYYLFEEGHSRATPQPGHYNSKVKRFFKE